MISSDFRTDARRKLDGKWGKAVCIVLASLLISIAINAIQSIFPDDSLISSVASLAAAIIEVPIQFGLIFAFLKLFLGEDVKAFDFLKLGFSDGNIAIAANVASRTASRACATEAASPTTLTCSISDNSCVSAVSLREPVS